MCGGVKAPSFPFFLRWLLTALEMRAVFCFRVFGFYGSLRRCRVVFGQTLGGRFGENVV